MGLMEPLPGHSRLIATPHPVTLEGQRSIAAQIVPGETLGALLRRTVPDWTGDTWEVRINGVLVPVEVMERVRPKDGTVIEARGVVRKQALYIVAMIALTYFTFGFGAATAGAWGAGAVAGAYGAVAATAVYMAGSMLINKVLAPKAPSISASNPDSVYSISGSRNTTREYQPLPLVFGTVRVTPDIISKPYTWYEGNDQYLGMVLTPGINVASVDELYLGDALLSSFDDVTTWYSGFSDMPEQTIPLYSNVDTVDGGELPDTTAWVQRTTSADTVRIQINLEYILGGQGTSGKNYQVSETVQAQYCPAGTDAWAPLVSRTFTSSKLDTTRRATLAADVARGQYDVRVRILGQGNYTGKNTQRNDFQWSTLSSVQADDVQYPGIPRIGIRMKATGQLNGAPDEIRCVAHTKAVPVWDGSAWVTQETSNPGAHILAYARGYTDENGKRIAGIGLREEMIDVEALKAFMLHCAANDYTYNYCVKEARSHDDMINALALAGMGQVTWAGGKLSVVWAADEQPLGGVVNMATIKKGQFQIDYTLANAADGIEYSYYDSETWETKTLRVAAPGVETMLNPAQVTGEGITSEAHAAEMARYHLAQSLYQYKDIGYITDIEHLAYRRMSVLALQHDLTQWGFGGRVMSAVNTGGAVTLTLDEPVPAPSAGNAFIGLRIPGEQIYRVFGVQSFAGESKTITLTGTWPNDAALPGDSDDNPAHDTIWIYDFKQTPGYRVRVVGIEPESDLKGASISVVPEPPEFWHYVKTGEYIPPANQSLLQTRPIASNLKVSEEQVVQGDTVFTELVATFDVTGPVGRSVVLSDLDGNGALEQVADTVTRTARWRIPGAGTYSVTVRPYNPDGMAGIAISAIYTTAGADAAPVLVDTFNVEQLSGGVRRYTWGFNDDTIQSADFAGVEIRYVAGTVEAPDWDAMTPLGDDGYHAAAFEAVLPESGTWTFACRSRNTAGTLSTAARILTVMLADNLGQVIEQNIAALVVAQQEIDQEKVDRFNADAAEQAARVAAISALAGDLAAEATTRAQETQANANAITQEAAARADAVLNAKLELQANINTESTLRQSADESLASQIATISAGTGEQFDSRQIWYFDTSVDGWMGQNSTGVVTPTVTDGWIRFPNGTNPFLVSPTGLGIAADTYKYSKLRIRKTGSPAWEGSLRWRTVGQPGNWGDSAVINQLVSIDEPTFDANHIATIDFRDVPWTGTLDQIRLDMSTSADASNYYEADWIAVGRPSPGASAAALQEEREARISGDAAQATARETLAAQVRGTYEGTDIAQVTQGLMYSERIARATADSANASNISAVIARMPDGTGKVATEASVTAEQAARVAGDQANASNISAVTARMPSGTGVLATSAQVADEASARATGDSALGERVGVVEARMPSGSGQLATSAQVTSVDTASVNRDSALGERVGVVEARMPSGTGVLATAASVTTVDQASVSRDTALGQRIDSTNAALDGKASASALASLNSTVTQQGNSINAQGSAISSVQSTLGSVGNPNLLYNATGANGSVGYTFIGTSASLFSTPTEFFGRFGNFFAFGPIVASGTAFDIGINTPVDYYVPVPNASASSFTVSADIYRHSASGSSEPYIEIRFINSSNAEVSGSTRRRIYGSSMGWSRPSLTFVPPATTAKFQVILRHSGTTTAANSYSGWSKIKVEAGTIATPFTDDSTVNKTASVTQSLTARTTTNENGIASLMAQYFLSVVAGGYVGGMKIGNDGTTVATRFLSDIFEVVTPTGNTGIEFKSGYLRVYNANYQHIIGNGFGDGGNLMMYFGPNVGVAAASTANAIECKTTAGMTITRSGTSGNRIETNNGTISVYDANNVRRIRIGL